uniref:Uncharacterized protein n=1 Tax=Knipowitschia caucasica TaxID=637954 RepID=A0AAV2KH54_KNICA
MVRLGIASTLNERCAREPREPHVQLDLSLGARAVDGWGRAHGSQLEPGNRFPFRSVKFASEQRKGRHKHIAHLANREDDRRSLWGSSATGPAAPGPGPRQRPLARAGHAVPRGGHQVALGVLKTTPKHEASTPHAAQRGSGERSVLNSPLEEDLLTLSDFGEGKQRWRRIVIRGVSSRRSFRDVSLRNTVHNQTRNKHDIRDVESQDKYLHYF